MCRFIQYIVLYASFCAPYLAEAPIKGKNIFEYSKNSNGAKDYMALAQEVLKLK